MPADAPPPGRRARVAALLAALLLAVAAYAVAQAVAHHNARQDCLDAGRRDCDAPAGS